MPTRVLREITPLGEHDFMYVADRHKKEFDYPIHQHEIDGWCGLSSSGR